MVTDKTTISSDISTCTFASMTTTYGRTIISVNANTTILTISIITGTSGILGTITTIDSLSDQSSNPSTDRSDNTKAENPLGRFFTIFSYLQTKPNLCNVLGYSCIRCRVACGRTTWTVKVDPPPGEQGSRDNDKFAKGFAVFGGRFCLYFHGHDISMQA